MFQCVMFAGFFTGTAGLAATFHKNGLAWAKASLVPSELNARSELATNWSGSTAAAGKGVFHAYASPGSGSTRGPAVVPPAVNRRVPSGLKARTRVAWRWPGKAAVA